MQSLLAAVAQVVHLLLVVAVVEQVVIRQAGLMFQIAQQLELVVQQYR
jgi:hypothetical protein